MVIAVTAAPSPHVQILAQLIALFEEHGMPGRGQHRSRSSTACRRRLHPRFLDELVPAAWHHVERWANNRIEADHSLFEAPTQTDARAPHRPDRDRRISGWHPCRTSASGPLRTRHRPTITAAGHRAFTELALSDPTSSRAREMFNAPIIRFDQRRPHARVTNRPDPPGHHHRTRVHAEPPTWPLRNRHRNPTPDTSRRREIELAAAI